MAGHPPQPPRTNTVVHQFGIYEDPTGGGPLKTQSSVQFRTPGPPVQAMTMKDLREFVESTTEVPDTADLDPLTVDTGSQLDPIAILVGLRVQWEGES
jgi:hypothetical protein